MRVKSSAFQIGHSSTCMCYCCFNSGRRNMKKNRGMQKFQWRQRMVGTRCWAPHMEAVGFTFLPQQWCLLLWPSCALMEHRAGMLHGFSRGRHLQMMRYLRLAIGNLRMWACWEAWKTYDMQIVVLCLLHKNFLKVSFDQNNLKWVIRRDMKGARSKKRHWITLGGFTFNKY